MNSGLASAPVLLEGLVTAFAVLGGFMAVASGSLSSAALLKRRAPWVISERVNAGIAGGFLVGVAPALFAFIIVLSVR
jgi:hypothetical protein